MRVVVALSGGVDSAVVASLLKEQGHEVIGASHRHWPESRCCSTECIDRCAEQCQNMGIAYHPVDCMVEFAQSIVENFVRSYERGLTPNPCVFCNQKIRFELMFTKLLEKLPELKNTETKVASGHYARIEQRDGHYYLKRGLDQSKDQSYMLHRLSQTQLARCLFPLGEFQKSEVRQMAQERQLKSAKIGDSQDVCFVMDKYQTFLDQYNGYAQEPGDYVDLDGKVIGKHKGVAYHTRGQRKGLGLSGGPWYVIRLDVKSRQVVLGRREDLPVRHFAVHDLNWVYGDLPKVFEAKVQTRYHAKEKSCRIEKVSDDHWQVELERGDEDVTSGQAAVFYKEDEVLGGGIIGQITN